jgi:hypothetical protein
LGLLAFTIDVGYIAWVATDLQTAADAAALAGAEKLQELYVQYTLPGQVNKSSTLSRATTNTCDSPIATAEAFCSCNKAGNVAILLRDEDITFGYMTSHGTYHSNYGEYNGGFPNSITVVARRDDKSNSPLSLFFGALFGFPTKNLTATATATIYSGDVTSLRAIAGVNAHILPVALDMNIWKTFYTTGLSPDGTMHVAANGSPQLQVYPCDATNTPPSFGLLDLGPPSKQTPAFQNWSNEGDTPNDINYLVNQSLVPVSTGNPKNWKCGPDLTGTLLNNFQSQMGVPNLIPLFDPAGTPCANASYPIVGFVGVAISQADLSCGCMAISIQPSAIIDPTAVIPTAKPVGTQKSQFGPQTMITTFISAKLTQ